MIYEETWKWAHQRKAFGKPLIAQAVVRHKFAGILAKVESLQGKRCLCACEATSDEPRSLA